MVSQDLISDTYFGMHSLQQDFDICRGTRTVLKSQFNKLYNIETIHDACP